MGERVSAIRSRHIGALLGMRPARGQHTAAEAEALERWARGRRRGVEIGVAEGVSAARIRRAMGLGANFWLVDPYQTRHVVSVAQLVARRSLRRSSGADITWVRKLSHDAAAEWFGPIDFLFIDGDHSESACEQDWLDWSTWMVPGGVVAFHDSALGASSQARPDWGPVRVVTRLFRETASRVPGWEVVAEVDSLTVVRRTPAASPG
jgi:predicted O-methyltransferase YrrM